ncbi:MAG: tetratricopeptide repeat protein [Brevinematales bacterium]|nr:tetratricopeptide repeat protein [Brevinematales bacterium]
MQKNQEKIFFSWGEYIQKHWFGIALSVVGGVIVVIGLLFWFSREAEQEAKASSAYDEAVLVLAYQLPQAGTNQQLVNEISQYVLAKLDSVQKQFPRTLAAMRARILLGRLYANSYLSQGAEDAYNQALQLYDEVARMASSSFYRGLALINKAQLLEHHADWQGALETYRIVARKYNEFYTPYAWVSLGRVGEIMGDKNTALSAYETVVQKYTNSSWYGFALARLTIVRQYGVSTSTNAPAPVLSNTLSLPNP